MKSAFAQVRVLLLGNGLAQLLQFGSILILSRIYQPHDFGFLAQIQSIATLTVVVATLQLHLLIPMSKSLEDARAVTSSVESLCVVMVLCALPACLWFGSKAAFALAITLAVGLSTTYSVYLVYEGKFHGLSRFYVARAVLIIFVQLLFVLLNLTDGLIWAAAIGEISAAAYLRWNRLRSLPLRLNILGIRDVVFHQGYFPLFATLQELVSVSAYYAPLLLFTATFGEAIAGHYAMASRLIWAPVILLSGSVVQVLYHRFGQSPPTSFQGLWDARRGPRILLAIILICACSFLLEDLYFRALGPQWRLASQLIPLHIVWGGIFFLSTPFRVACRVLKLQRIQLMIDAVMLVSIVGVFSIPGMTPIQLMWALVGIAVAQNSALALFISLSIGGGRTAKAVP